MTTSLSLNKYYDHNKVIFKNNTNELGGEGKKCLVRTKRSHPLKYVSGGY